MKSAVFASALALAGAEKVNLTYKDCGSSSTHAKITSLKPDSIDVPGKVSIVGSGALDSDQTTAHFSLKVKKGIIPFVSGKGNICEDTTINLPLGAGSFTVKGLDCPITAGNVDVEVDLDLLSEDLFDGENSLLTIHIDANADDTGDQVICLDVDASLAGDATVTSEAGTLSMTYSDCGSKHGQVTSMSPTSFPLGGTTTVTGTGTIDEDVSAANIAATVSALGTKLTDCSGDGNSDIVCTLPLGVGTITVPKLPFPLAKGTLNLPVVVTSSASIPPSLANLDIHLTGDDQNGESAICLDVHTTASSLGSAGGACTSDEQATLADPQEVGDKANTCGTTAFNIITGKFDHDKFNNCFSSSIGISTACAECYAATGEYGAKNCKADCLLGWCKSGCLSCTEPAQETLATCTGFTAGTADPCEDKAQGFLATSTV